MHRTYASYSFIQLVLPTCGHHLGHEARGFILPRPAGGMLEMTASGELSGGELVTGRPSSHFQQVVGKMVFIWADCFTSLCNMSCHAPPASVRHVLSVLGASGRYSVMSVFSHVLAFFSVWLCRRTLMICIDMSQLARKGFGRTYRVHCFCCLFCPNRAIVHGEVYTYMWPREKSPSQMLC